MRPRRPLTRTFGGVVHPARLLVLAGAALAASIASGCPLPAAQAGEQRIESGPLALTWVGDPGPPVVGRPFAISIHLCPAAAKVLRVDATMPEHRHGMNYRPSVRSLGPGLWRAEGLLWHMAGRWELAIEVDDGGQRHWLRQSVQLP